MIGKEVIIKDKRFCEGTKAKIIEDCKLMDMWLVNLYQEDNKTSDQYNVLYISKDKVQIIKTEKELYNEKVIKYYEHMINEMQKTINELKNQGE